MKSTRLFRPLALALLTLAAALPGAVRADTLTSTYQFPVTNFSSQGPIGPETAPFPQFDPSLGTLTAASVHFGYYFAVSEYWEPTGEAYFQFGGGVSINNTNQTVIATPGSNYLVSGIGYGSDNTVWYVGDRGDSVSVPQSDLGLLAGNSNYSIVYNPTFQQTYGSPISGGAQVTGLNSTSFTTVTYTFTPNPVPEPSTWALLGLGGAGLLTLTLRHRRAVRLG